MDQRSEEPPHRYIANDGVVFTYGSFESRIQWDLQENLAITSLFDIKLKMIIIRMGYFVFNCDLCDKIVQNNVYDCFDILYPNNGSC